jgi:membrane-associated phospholipid phosphatase
LSTRIDGRPPRFHRPLLVISGIAGGLAIALSVLVFIHPFLAIDATIEKDVQSVSYGPLTSVFGFYTQIGGPLAIAGEAVVFALVLLLNRQAWRLLIAAALASGWYFLLSNVIIRARPSVPEVLRVTEHPGASSYPSGHMILFMFYAVVLMVCLGYRYLPRGRIPYGWALATVLVVIGGTSRIYSGAHWPTDVLAGGLIATSWLSLVVAVRWISDPVLMPRARIASGATRQGKALPGA